MTRLSDALRSATSSLLESSLEGQRLSWEGIGAAYPVPPDTEVTSVELGGVPAERVAAADADARRCVLHLHGGGYVIGSCVTHRELAARLSHACGVPVYVPDYRRAPEHVFPAAFDDAQGAFEAVAARHGASSVVLSGDSAGGGLALAVAQEAARRGRGAPRRLVLWSPWADLSVAEHAVADAVLTPAWLEWCARSYLGDTLASDGRASPLRGSFSGLPPTLVLVAAAELLYSQARQVVDALRGADVEVELESWDHDVHLWMLLGPTTPEAREALDRAGGFIRAGWDGGAVP